MMCENNLNNKRTPLRNSNSANKPFRSPLATVITPNNHESPKNAHLQSLMQKTATPKSSTSQFRHPIKRRRIETTPSYDSKDKNPEGEITQIDLFSLKRRVHDKRMELDNLKTKSNYLKKHKNEDLLALIDKWRAACKEALYQIHRDIKAKNSEHISMGQIISMLGVPKDIVKFTPDECDFA